MAIATSEDHTAWQADIVAASDTPFQCQVGVARVTWDTGAAVGDGLLLTAGQTVVIPSGATFRWAPDGTVSTTVFYEAFGV